MALCLTLCAAEYHSLMQIQCALLTNSNQTLQSFPWLTSLDCVHHCWINIQKLWGWSQTWITVVMILFAVFVFYHHLKMLCAIMGLVLQLDKLPHSNIGILCVWYMFVWTCLYSVLRAVCWSYFSWFLHKFWFCTLWFSLF